MYNSKSQGHRESRTNLLDHVHDVGDESEHKEDYGCSEKWLPVGDSIRESISIY